MVRVRREPQRTLDRKLEENGLHSEENVGSDRAFQVAFELGWTDEEKGLGRQSWDEVPGLGEKQDPVQRGRTGYCVPDPTSWARIKAM